jgi:hypothetical protein
MFRYLMLGVLLMLPLNDSAVLAGEMSKKRAGPAAVAPVTIGQVRYEALPWGRMRELDQNGGYIAAVDANSGQELWILKVYDVRYDGDMEDDKQDLFITRIEPKDSRTLLIENENGERFIVDLPTRIIKPE